MKRVVRAAAGRILDVLLHSPAGGLVERNLCRLARVAPGGVPGSGVIVERLMARHGGASLIVTLSDGLRLSVPSATDGWGLYLRGRMCAEDEALARLLRRFLQRGDVCFDVGANLTLLLDANVVVEFREPKRTIDSSRERRIAS